MTLPACNICKRELNVLDDPTTLDCGGDCLRCMADVADDPDCEHHMAALAWARLSNDVRRMVYAAGEDADRLDKYFGDIT